MPAYLSNLGEKSLCQKTRNYDDSLQKFSRLYIKVKKSRAQNGIIQRM